MDELVRSQLVQAVRFFLIVLGVIVLALGACFVWMLPYERSPLRIIDTSYGAPDPALCLALESAILGPQAAHAHGDTSTIHSYETAPDVGTLTDAEFRERVGGVAGWDALVVFQPYAHPADIPVDPAIESWWLQRQIDHTEGVPQDAYPKVIVIRDQQSVGEIVLHGEIETSGVVTRSASDTRWR